MKLLRNAALAVLLAVPGFSASAAVIDFDNATLGTHTGYVEDGFTFDKVRVVRAWCKGAPQNCGSENQFVDSTLTRVGGGLFNLTSMWISLVASTPITFVTDYGTIAYGIGSSVGNEVIEIEKGYVVDFTANSIFQNISFLKIVDTTLGTEGTGVFKGNLRFDNIDVTEVAPVPLPAAGALMMAGLGGLAMLRRRKRA